MPTAVIADDERLMREQLRMRLAAVWPSLEILAEATNGEEAVELTQRLRPDIVFLDIRMPGKTGLDAAAEIGGDAHIVFITAYDQYAITAFERGAIDYVLKPAETERLQVTVERIRKRLDAPPADMTAVLAQLAQQLNGASKANYLKWIQASISQELRLIAVEEVLFFTSDEKYTRVQTSSYEALIRKPIRELLEELDPALFWQIHRATLVNVNAIEGVKRDIRGRHVVHIKGRPDRLEVSRGFIHLFKQM